MTRSRPHLLAVVALALVAGAGCAITSKSAAMPVRYYTPEVAREREPAPASVAAVPGAQLRLGRVNAAAYIRDKIVYRTSAHEIGFHESWRWTEDAEATVRRALARELFQTHGLRQTISGPGITLEVDLDAFEDRQRPRRAARVELTWRLRDDRLVRVQRTVVVERPILRHGDKLTGEEVAVAMSGALAAALDQIVGEVLTALASTPGAIPPPGTPPAPVERNAALP